MRQNDKIKKLRIKVCGMRDEQNISELIRLPIDYIGFIFYHGSPRFVGTRIDPSILNLIPAKIQKVGVFVNSTEEEILKIATENEIEILQLHGNESPEFCDNLSAKGFTILKSISVDQETFSQKLIDYRFCCNYYLFDTPTTRHGGSGQKFNWKILSNYKIYLPFFLSGGISPEDAQTIKKLDIPGLHAIDLNSKFEIEPGLKNIKLIKDFIKKIESD